MPAILRGRVRTPATAGTASPGPAAGTSRPPPARRTRTRTRRTSRLDSSHRAAGSPSPRAASSPSSASTASSGNGSPGPAPQHGAQLVVLVEGQPVVDAVHPVRGVPRRTTAQHVTALAVGVVDDGVEQRHPQQVGVVGVREHHVLTLVPAGVEDRAPPRRHRLGRYDVDEAGSRVGRRPGPGSTQACAIPAPEGPVRSPHRRRHDIPAGRLGHRVRRDLAPAQRPVGEVPQRAFAARRLVDAGDVDAVEARVRRRAWRCSRRRAARSARGRPGLRTSRSSSVRDDWHDGLLSRQRRLSGGSRWRAGRCGPDGSSGRLQNGHGGRPADDHGHAPA